MKHDVVSPVLVGRRGELARLHALLDRTAGGRAAVALLGGEAGVGKSRLVRELSRTAASRGMRVLSGGCTELGGAGLALAPLVDVLRALARSAPAGELDRLLGPARREFARLLPELDPSAAGASAADGSPAQLLEHVLALVTQLAAERPVLLIVEDLHWADRSTRDLMVFLARTLREHGVLLLMTYRSDELHRRHPLRPLLTAWERARAVEHIELGRFTRDEVVCQLHAIREARPPAAFASVVFERSQGNAFLVEEIVAAVYDGADPGDLPSSLRDVLLARTETVSEPTQRVLRTAAAAGSRVDHRLLEAVAGMTGAEVCAAVREAVEHHLLVVDATGHGYAFRHELTRDAVYDDMLPANGYGCTPRTAAPWRRSPRCSATTAAWRRHSPTTGTRRWICPGRSPHRCAPPARPPRRTRRRTPGATSSGPCGSGPACRMRKRWPGWTGSSSACCRRRRPGRPATPPADCPSSTGRWPRPSRAGRARRSAGRAPRAVGRAPRAARARAARARAARARAWAARARAWAARVGRAPRAAAGAASGPCSGPG
ncbi:AAA family ATPase [Actinoplanes sp. KI2]|uniref:ATP-binding protein n=1 Tax=Actinoplanes sp. KI2 TaxID=2983315 RepID=UPI0021D5BBF2|nr:AAA family ATPase [Actinoplanes sp. KI2]MCU7724398.1 AAA family ATPase [Actinoplanes sp. KI2]